jgi:hypothetical protein
MLRINRRSLQTKTTARIGFGNRRSKMLRYSRFHPKQLLDLTGKQFGKLTVIERAPNSPFGSARWIVECSCPLRTRKTVTGVNLRRSKGCGCVRRDSELNTAKCKLGAAKGGAITAPKLHKRFRAAQTGMWDPDKRLARYGAHCLVHRDAGKVNLQCEFCLGAPYKETEET